MFLDATYCKVRINQRVVSQAVVIATGVSADGRREVLGCAVGDSETEAFWTEFLRDLRDRGLTGVQLVISDAHRGLTNAVATVLQGAPWQRCRVHFMRNALAKVTKGHAEMVAATIRTIFAQPDRRRGPRPRSTLVADMLAGQFPAVADMLLDAKADLTAFADFPHAALAARSGRTNPLERLNREVKRRTDVVGIFPNTDSLLRLSRLRADRGPRRVARQRPPLPVRGVHGPAQPTRADRPRGQDRHPPTKTTEGGSPLRHSCSHSQSNTRRATPLPGTRPRTSDRLSPERFRRPAKRLLDAQQRQSARRASMA